MRAAVLGLPVVVFENASHHLFRDREADVIQGMVTFYERFEKSACVY